MTSLLFWAIAAPILAAPPSPSRQEAPSGVTLEIYDVRDLCPIPEVDEADPTTGRQTPAREREAVELMASVLERLTAPWLAPPATAQYPRRRSPGLQPPRTAPGTTTPR